MLALIPAFLQSLGWTELIIIGAVGVLLFGKRLPELGRTLGKSLVSFRKGMTEMKDEIVKGVNEPVAENLPENSDQQPLVTEIKIDANQNQQKSENSPPA